MALVDFVSPAVSTCVIAPWIESRFEVYFCKICFIANQRRSRRKGEQGRIRHRLGRRMFCQSPYNTHGTTTNLIIQRTSTFSSFAQIHVLFDQTCDHTERIWCVSSINLFFICVPKVTECYVFACNSSFILNVLITEQAI